MVQLNAKLEVADFVDESQFEAGESAFMCVAFCAALCRYAGEPGKGPTGTGEQVDTTADFWYAKLEGSSAAANTNGMSLQAEYDMLAGLGMHYHALPITGNDAHNAEYVKAWVKLGYPVLICGSEVGMVDIEMGRVPYSWTPTGNHAIVASGIASDGNLLVRDTASIASAGVRPGPRHYAIAPMRMVSATAVSMPWLAELASNYDPLEGASMNIPTNWHDDGKTLTAPNGIPVVLGFRAYILSHPWEAGNMPIEKEHGQNPLEEANPALGSGTQQIFRSTVLEWTQAGSVFEMWVGPELAKTRQQASSLYADNQTLRAQIAALQSQVAPIADARVAKFEQMMAIGNAV